MDKTTILVADDDIETCNIIEKYILWEGKCNVIKASNGIDALKIMMTEKIELSLLDYDMPGENGISICRKIKDISHAKIIIMSSLHDMDIKNQALKSGALEYIEKPFPMRDLINTLKKYII